jgi:hypothetical protein
MSRAVGRHSASNSLPVAALALVGVRTTAADLKLIEASVSGAQRLSAPPERKGAANRDIS